MQIEQFKAPEVGELVQISGIHGTGHAFVPAPLPPRWEWPVEMWPLLMEARERLASLNGIGKHLRDPDLILRPLQYREAVRSSSLEGTTTQPQQQMMFELDPSLLDNERGIDAYREISNYRRALQYYNSETAAQLPLSLRLIRDLHSILMDGVRGADKEPGCFRRLQVQIGQPPRFVPPPPNQLAECLNDFEHYLNAETRPYDPLVDTFLIHYQFETIHPFRDGKGRVGRLLLSILIAEWLQMSAQWLHMSAYFDDNRNEYIDRLFRISTEGDWRGWIEFCLYGVIVQAKDTDGRCSKLLQLSQKYHEKIREMGGNIRLSKIVDDLFVTPMLQVPYVASRCNVTYPTARADINKLVKAGIVKEIPDSWPKMYICAEILDVIYD